MKTLYPVFETTRLPFEKSMVAPKHAEQLLYEAPNANKYYNAFQSYNRQFVENEHNDGKVVVRWHNSAIQKIQVRVFETWLRRRGEEEDSAKSKTKPESKNTTRSALFAWSSGDSTVPYSNTNKNSVALTLKLNSSLTKPSSEGSSSGTQDPEKLPKGLNLVASKESITNRLHKMVDQEASRLLQERIQDIKEHHMEEMSKQISERKRKDHELHLLRLKKREEEYEEKFYNTNETSKPGFFGTLFGFSTPPTDKSEFNDDTHSIGEAFKPTASPNSNRFSLLTWGATESKESISPKPKLASSFEANDGTLESPPTTPVSRSLKKNSPLKRTDILNEGNNKPNNDTKNLDEDDSAGDDTIIHSKADVPQVPQSTCLTPRTPTWNMKALAFSPPSTNLGVLLSTKATPSSLKTTTNSSVIHSGVILEVEGNHTNGNINNIDGDDNDDDDDDDDDEDDDDDFDEFVSSNTV
ncbi:uncharacterized protein KQ657_000148 [Scheffersomyces spartinae]|uniref:Uncharacterized protein n=1 Tax=Scheffersomyces spartinae TaxID=45513 RepID=A0A9P7VF67_9ASCO|nr:uncharacterized protein KQ657_000148 [Scheffersomyces spartinae]KAG7196136.1 hypothetical protein KQ657_000148 [Scheffersomyces spartinae]